MPNNSIQNCQEFQNLSSAEYNGNCWDIDRAKLLFSIVKTKSQGLTILNLPAIPTKATKNLGLSGCESCSDGHVGEGQHGC